MNKVVLIGRVGKDPEIKSFNNGGKVANFSLATSETWRDKQTGDKKERVEWHRIAVFNEGLVKVIEQYVKKGALLFIEGSLQTRKWTDQSGTEKYTTEIVLAAFNGSLTMLDGGPAKAPEDDLNNDGGFGTAKPGTKKSPKVSQKIDDEIPF